MKTLLALLLLAAALRAEDATPKAQAVQVAGEPGHYSVLTTARGTTYRDVRVKSVTASLIKFMHVDGMATLPLIEMPLLLQELHGFNPREAAAELPLVKQQRLKGLAEAAESKAAQAALLERQKAEHNAIRAIEGQKIKLRLDTTQVKPDGTQCDAWRIVMVEIKGKHSLSSGLMQQEGITQELPLHIFVAGMKDVAEHTTLVAWIYPVDEKKHLYAISADRAYTEKKKLAAKQPQQAGAAPAR